MKKIFGRKSVKNNALDVISSAVENTRRRTHNIVEACIMSTVYVVLSDKFGFSKEDIQRFKTEVDNLSDSINGNYLSYKDLLDTSIEEFEVEFPKEQIDEIKSLVG